MPYYQKKDGSYTEWVDNNNIVVNQWNKVCGRKTVHPEDKYGPLSVQEGGPKKGQIWENGSGRVVSPKFVESLYKQGYIFCEGRNWFYREWSTWSPERNFSDPQALGRSRRVRVWETYQLTIEHNWIYRIVDPRCLGGLGGGGNGGGWCIWEEDQGSKDIKK